MYLYIRSKECIQDTNVAYTHTHTHIQTHSKYRQNKLNQNKNTKQKQKTIEQTNENSMIDMMIMIGEIGMDMDM